MAIMKCKMCGGDLKLLEGSRIAQCEYCGTRQTVPSPDSEKKLTMFARANGLLQACEFDRAAGVYESLAAAFPQEAEAYWGLVLCKYGIEYVDDPATGKKVPTCHRSSYDSVLRDSNYKLACSHAEPEARELYEQEAAFLENLRKDILSVSSLEAPYDLFLCYKESEENGERTRDSVLAQDLYLALTKEGWRVFFSRISLENKLGTAYEPYIFAALRSAKIMVVVGTSREHLESVWVRNEWSRFLQLMETDSQKYLIPCCASMDPYDLPEEFSRLQAQDLGKVGAVQDLLWGVQKLLGGQQAPAQVPGGEALLTRGQLSLEDGAWEEADRFFEQVLNQNPMEGRAYLGKFLVSRRIKSLRSLEGENLQPDGLRADRNVQKALRFGDASVQQEFAALFGALEAREEEKRRAEQEAREKQEAERLAREAEQRRLEEEKRREAEAQRQQRLAEKQQRLERRQHQRQAAAAALAQKRQAAAAARTEKKQRKRPQPDRRLGLWMGAAAAVVLAAGVTTFLLTSPAKPYEEALQLRKQENYPQAYCAFEALGDYKDSANLAQDCRYQAALQWKDRGENLQALAIFEALGDYEDSTAQALACRYALAVEAREQQRLDTALGAFEALGDYEDSAAQAQACRYERAMELQKAGQTEEARAMLQALTEAGYDAGGEALEADHLARGRALLEDGHITEAYGQLKAAGPEGAALLKEFWTERSTQNTVAVGSDRTVALRTDGTVLCTDPETQAAMEDWSEVYSLHGTVAALRTDGTVLCTDPELQAELASWSEIVAIAGNGMGLRANGTVVTAGWDGAKKTIAEAWTDVVAISGETALRADGTVLDLGENAEEKAGWTNVVSLWCGGDAAICADGTARMIGFQEEVAGWTDLVALDGQGNTVVGLRSDGTAVAAGYNQFGQCNVGRWKDLVKVIGEGSRTLGLRSDGTVVAVGFDWCGQCNVTGWTDIVDLAVSGTYNVALRSDGTLLAGGENNHGQKNVKNWTDIQIPKGQEGAE